MRAETAAMIMMSNSQPDLEDITIHENGVYESVDHDGFKTVTVDVAGGLTLDYILTHGHPLLSTPAQIAEGTELEETLADYSVNFYILEWVDEIGYITNIAGSIGDTPMEVRDNFVGSKYIHYKLFNVFYANGEPLWAQELYVTDGNRESESYSYYTWGTPISEYAKPSSDRHFTDWDYQIYISGETKYDFQTLISGIFTATFNISSMSSGYIQIGMKTTGSSSSYAQFPRTQTYYYYEFDYTADPPYKLIRTNTSQGYFNVSFNIRFPYDNTYSYAIYDRISDLSKQELDQIIMGISMQIYKYYIDSRN